MLNSTTRNSSQRNLSLQIERRQFFSNKENDFTKMSAKLSLDKSNQVRREYANPPSPDHGKTLKPCSEKPDNKWNEYYLSGLTK